MTEKILIIDDDLETLRLLGIMLQRHGYHVYSATNGKEGLSRAIQEKPNLIILDLGLPDIDGLEIARQIRKNEITTSIPLIIFTARRETDGETVGLQAGADDYLIKPVRPPELIARIKAQIGRKIESTKPEKPKEAYVSGFLAARGGQGVSTLLYNLAIILSQTHEVNLIAAELRPGMGTWASDLGFDHANSLGALLSLPVEKITQEAVNQKIFKSPHGFPCICASSKIQDAFDFFDKAPQTDAIINKLSTLTQLLLLDIGNPYLPGYEQITNLCDELIIVSEPQPAAIRRTIQLIEGLRSIQSNQSKPIYLIVHNRYFAEVQLSAMQIQEMLGQPIYLVIPPVPELAFQSSVRNIPLIHVQADSLYTQQVSRLAGLFVEKINK